MYSYSAFFELLASNKRYALGIAGVVIVIYWVYSIVITRLCRRRGMDICAKGFVVGYNILLVPKLLLAMFLQRPKKPKKTKRKLRKRKVTPSQKFLQKKKKILDIGCRVL